MISIHALREESDGMSISTPFFQFISIHALREESDLQTLAANSRTPIFLSTLSVRRATRFFRNWCIPL